MSKIQSFRARLLYSSYCAIAMAFFSTPSAFAQDQVETVVVTGEKYALEKSIDDKRRANVVSDGIASDEIGAIPEYGLGDALRKVVGVSLVINNGRGEDQFLTLRGLNPDYNTVTIDGMALASTEETRRQVSLDILPSVLVNAVNIDKSWTVDQPSDAIGGVTDLHTRSAFDHPGLFFDSHVDYAYWEDTEKVHNEMPSGEGNFTVSDTFGPSDEFGVVVLGSYFQRSSSTLNTYTLPYSYYPYSGSGTATNVAAIEPAHATTTSDTLNPSDIVTGDVAIPDRHRWYFYDNDRTRPGVFGRFDFNDHKMFYAHVSGGLFEFINDENRYSQYLSRIGNPTITSPTTGSFAQGNAEADFDRYVQYRQITYADAGGGVKLSPDMHVDLFLNYSTGHYKQTTAEDQFLYNSTAAVPGSDLAFNYDLNAPTAPLFTPVTVANFMNPAKYNWSYHLNAVDTSTSHLPQARLEFNYNDDGDSNGLGFKAGWSWRQLSQLYYYNQTRVNATGTKPTLATIGSINKNVPLYDGEGQSLLLVSDNLVTSYMAQNPTSYVPNSSDALSNTINNFRLKEMIQAGYAEAQYKKGAFYALLGLRYETTNQNIVNYQPVPFSSTSNFVQTTTPAKHSKLLPSLNLAYDVTDEIKLRGAVTQNLGRPQYAQLAQNGSATVSGTTASETISNPNLKPRESTNYDLSAEYYPAEGVLTSVAIYDKEIKNEIVTLTTTTPNVTVPGYPTPVTLTITTPENVDKARVQGLEIGLSDVKFAFLPSFLSDFGGSANISFVSMNTPQIRMSDGSFRKLPQLLESSKFVTNATLLYSHGAYSGELAYNYTSKMPLSFDTNNAVNDQWWAGIGTIDAQVNYKLDDNISFRIQGKNLTDSRPQKVVGPTQELNYSTLENGRAFYIGIGATF
ncbi:MAG: TonB-dependent receptor [Rhizomicrobium sp.]